MQAIALLSRRQVGIDKLKAAMEVGDQLNSNRKFFPLTA
jgi:hypothetical protein